MKEASRLLRTYYRVNRETCPEMTRRAALFDAWRLTRRVTKKSEAGARAVSPLTDIPEEPR